MDPGLKILLLVMVIILTVRCVEEYRPSLDETDKLLVVNGSFILGEEQQTIFVSRSTSVYTPLFVPVENCNVYVSDDQNNMFQFVEDIPGKYITHILPGQLEIGTKLKLTIETPDRQVYESGFEEIYDSPSIDSLYFAQETNTSDPMHKNENGIRMNLDVIADEESTGFYRWKLHETWEQHASQTRIEKELVGVQDTFGITWKWDSIDELYVRDKAIPYPDFKYFTTPDTIHICYLDSEVEEYFFSSTTDVLPGSRKRVPLHFIPNGPKISYRYSCLVNQYSLSENAYTYWQTKVTEIKESGGLYYTQPSQNLSNIININDDQETVIGYFWVSAVKQKRVFYDGPYVGRPGCATEQFFLGEFFEMDPDSAFGKFRRKDSTYIPVYVTDGNTGTPACFDCRFSGGTLDPPDFW
jgi:hypothetical protein